MPDAARPTPGRRLVARGRTALDSSRWWVGLLVAAIVWGLVLRLAAPSFQSYWTDELFSVRQTAGSFQNLWQSARTEVHPPLFAILLWGWTRIGGTAPEWTRLLSIGFSLLALVVPVLTLRRHLNWRVLLALSAATASCAMAIVYAQDVRSYALLHLAAAGLTASLLAWWLDPGRPHVHLWQLLGWTLLASATHLFGMVLAAAVFAVLVLLGRLPLLRAAALVLVGTAPQWLWLAHGLAFVPAFASGTTWIWAPGLADVQQLLSATYGLAGLEIFAGGFEWTIWLGAALVAMLVAVRCVARPSAAVPPSSDEEPSPADGGDSPTTQPASPSGHRPDELVGAAATLALLVVVVVVGMLLVSQVVHLWTLRNMIVVVPALTWAVVLWLCSAPTQRLAMLLACTQLVLLAGVTREVAQPYKTDFHAAVHYLADLRHSEPGFTYIGNGSALWLTGSGLPEGAEGARQVFGEDRVLTRGEFPQGISTRRGTTVYIMYLSINTETKQAGNTVINLAGGDRYCHHLPLTGLVAVRCDIP
ncbi:hypothetical protein ACPCG0_06000 [Propionibacteriaceae bacterium Y1923]|uniref:hypothetical protein n=1 Tax=Aestuariimicrobium sp. Y1814 TaxID=3418742 RepID=UPI003C16E85C